MAETQFVTDGWTQMDGVILICMEAEGTWGA